MLRMAGDPDSFDENMGLPGIVWVITHGHAQVFNLGRPKGICPIVPFVDFDAFTWNHFRHAGSGGGKSEQPKSLVIPGATVRAGAGQLHTTLKGRARTLFQSSVNARVVE